jgi:NADPH-dependent 2,4-dienoyl-CoA reductase/sulfur reductase-like enzyme
MGLDVSHHGVHVDESLRAVDGLYVAGDIAIHQHPVLGRAIRVEHWEVAKGQGRGIAASIADGDTPYRKIPYFWSDQYDVNLEYRGNASGEDHAVWRGDVDARKFSVFYLRDGRVDAVLSMNDAPGGEAGAKLIESRTQVDPRALADQSVEISALAG